MAIQITTIIAKCHSLKLMSDLINALDVHKA